MHPTSITSINSLPTSQMRSQYVKLIHPGIMERFNISSEFIDVDGNSLLNIKTKDGFNSVELSLYHQHGFQDPILYAHLTDTLNDQIHILLYIMNDPASPRFDVDIMPDGTRTQFGTLMRNIEAEKQALEAGLSPGQIRKGLKLASAAEKIFEAFARELGHEKYFVEPLYYHNAVIFEHFGFKYQSGRRRMEKIHADFTNSGELYKKLDGSIFRPKSARDSVRLRSWAIHDGIMGEPYNNVTMYKTVGKHAGVNTIGSTSW